MEKDLNEYTREEFLAIKHFGKDAEFNGIVIVPTDAIHDSGYRCMKFILTYYGKIVGAVSGWSDVMHINGIGGYGKNFDEAMKTGKVDVVGWNIDCLPVSGCVRLFTSKNVICRASEFIGSDFEFFVEGRKK